MTVQNAEPGSAEPDVRNSLLIGTGGHSSSPVFRAWYPGGGTVRAGSGTPQTTTSTQRKIRRSQELAI
jgi:hypothetical protein